MKNNLPVREILLLLLICSLLTLNVYSALCTTPGSTPCPDCDTGNGYTASLTDPTICNLNIANCDTWSADG